MGKNHFTEEQICELSKNPYIQRVSTTTITYTRELKEKFGEEYRAGRTPSQILINMGIDPCVLGKRRRDSLVQRIKQYALRAEGCEDTRKFNPGRLSTKNLSPTEKIKQLEQKLAYLKQENEFLKKNVQMDQAANWKHKRKPL